jgi:hypothetical protein
MTDLYTNVETVPIADIEPYERNPKEHPEEQIAKIAESIREFGFTVPMVVDSDGTIIAGHGRYYAVVDHLADDDGDDAVVPVIERDDMTEEQVRAFRIADNRVTESSWDVDILGEELNDLTFDELEPEVIGFDEDEIEFYDITAESDSNPNDAYEEWEENGAAEYENEDASSNYELKVHFYTEEAVQEFADLVGQDITTDTKYIYYPEEERENLDDKQWVVDDANGDSERTESDGETVADGGE